MRVRVERIRRGLRRPEIDYVETGGRRKRPDASPMVEPASGEAGREPDRFDRSDGLRLPWRIRRDRQ